MQLKVLLPSGIFFESDNVERIVAETRSGSFGILPHRRDCVAALAPGILTYQEANGSPAYLAVDEGALAKVGMKVLISVRRAIRGTDLGQLHDEVKRQFLTLNNEERQVRDALHKLESTFAGKLAEFAHER
ncbi:F0F1 ATP synthase subunit epsilon [Granulicella tundricola]|jgi:F-type H+-transporting ATPase subunit epsilon|uniref:ATPase, F1 complex, delta/epsilon subunit-like protein n=1 Tax=Granulicella tundricola (strain ATCC BAA-1859 / DSM 23138 / MP5ACTX9) TaxID=1198114 RepID=E8WVN7_GRATM|nr:F0F1 ATP synthase subunit epsilon [Granulicella tundricola]ADW69566.1 ATPase, F1 complex, delta/epsilon subunit-like protein [Granulicella tundricola MP5ACTX9]